MKRTWALPLLAVLSLAACAGRQPSPPSPPAATSKTMLPPSDAPAKWEEEESEVVALVADPLEPVNRAFFWFNEGLYFAVLRPVSRGYRFLVPKPLREGIANAFDNIRFPVRLANHLLQARFEDAGLETGKFLLNTTAGVGGLLKVSEKFPALAEVPASDTGQTLALWGVPHGFYIVWPVLGPASLRETVGMAGDMALNPVTWTGFIFGGGFFWGGPAWTSAITGAQALSDLPQRMDAYDAATKNALEKYIAAREAWSQVREARKAQAVRRTVFGSRRNEPAGQR